MMDEHIANIVNFLESFKQTEANIRQVRASVVAQLLATHVQLDRDADFDEIVGELQPRINVLVTKINEYVPLDVSLTVTVLRQLLVTRYQLIYGYNNIEVLRFTLSNKLNEASVDPKVNAVLNVIASDEKSLLGISQISADLIGAFQEEA